MTGFKWVQYNVGVATTSYNVGLGTTYLTHSISNENLKYLDLGTLNRQGFSTANNKYIGLKFFGFTPQNLRIYLKSPFADAWATGIGSTSEINKNLIDNGWDFRFCNASAPTIVKLDYCQGVSTAALSGISYTSSVFTGIATTSFASYFSYVNDGLIGVGSRFLVRKELDGRRNGIYSISSSYLIGSVGVYNLSRTYDMQSDYQTNLLARVGVKTSLTSYYGLYPISTPAQIGITSLLWVPQPAAINLSDSKLGINSNIIVSYCLATQQGVTLSVGDLVLLIGQSSNYNNGQYIVSSYISGLGNTVITLQRTGIVTGALSNQIYSYISTGNYAQQHMIIQLGIPVSANDYAYALGATGITFTSFNAYSLVYGPASSWVQWPYEKFSVFKGIPYALDTHPVYSNSKISYTDILSVNTKPPAWQISAEIRGLNFVAEFETINV